VSQCSLNYNKHLRVTLCFMELIVFQGISRNFRNVALQINIRDGRVLRNINRYIVKRVLLC
jgi:hypothetical protein